MMASSGLIDTLYTQATVETVMTSTPQMVEVPGYQVMQYLGSGARSTIWKVRDRQTNQYFALKRVVRKHLTDQRFLEQAINEYVVATHFDHPVVRKIYRIRKLKHWWRLREIHLVMELCPGNTVQAVRPTSIPQTVAVFQEVAAALAHMNSKGYVHADMKPNNILVDDGRRGEDHRPGPELPHRHGQAAHPGHAGLHRPRAGLPPPAGRPDRRVQLRRGPVLDAHRPGHPHRPAQEGRRAARDRPGHCPAARGERRGAAAAQPAGDRLHPHQSRPSGRPR